MAKTAERPTFWTLRGSPVFVFRLVLAALLVSTLLGTVYAATRREDIVASFTGAANDLVYGGLLVVGFSGLVALVGMWRWRRWSVLLYAMLGVASFVLDIFARAPSLHQLTVVVSTVLVLGLAYLNRHRFRATKPRAAG